MAMQGPSHPPPLGCSTADGSVPPDGLFNIRKMDEEIDKVQLQIRDVRGHVSNLIKRMNNGEDVFDELSEKQMLIMKKQRHLSNSIMLRREAYADWKSKKATALIALNFAFLMLLATDICWSSSPRDRSYEETSNKLY
jgi:predicted O-linked N-acetylglucosamine transferase (SPINDLY family)